MDRHHLSLAKKLQVRDNTLLRLVSIISTKSETGVFRNWDRVSVVRRMPWLVDRDMRQRSIQSRRSVSTRFVWYSLYAWSVPLIIVVVGQILDNVAGLPESVLRPQFGLYKCWFSGKCRRRSLNDHNSFQNNSPSYSFPKNLYLPFLTSCESRCSSISLKLDHFFSAGDWLDRTTILAYVYGPVAAILLCNIIFFVHTALRLYQGQRNRAFATSNQQDKQK